MDLIMETITNVYFLLTSSLIFIVGYLYFSWKFKYFKILGIPGPKPLPITGDLHKLWKKPAHITDWEEHKKYGKFYGMFEGINPVIHLCDPKEVHKIIFENEAFANYESSLGNHQHLLPTNTDKQKKVLTALKGSINSTVITELWISVQECCEQLIQNLKQDVEKKKPIDLQIPVSKFLAAFVMKCILGVPVNNDHPSLLDTIRKASSHYVPIYLPILACMPNCLQKFIQRDSSVKKAREELHHFILDKLHNESNFSQINESFLKYFLKESTKEKEKQDDYLESVSNTLMQMIISTQTVTSTALLQIIYYLSLNSNWQDHLQIEIDECSKKNNKLPPIKILQELKVLNAVIMETLRISPPVTRIERITTKQTKIGNVDIPKDLPLSISLYSLHRDASIYYEPQVYEPNRFVSKSYNYPKMTGYCPFGAAETGCPGKSIALSILQSAVYLLMKHYTFEPCTLTQIPFEASLLSTILSPQNGVWMKINCRI